MQKRDVIVIGGAVGSHQAVREIVRAFPDDFEAMVFVAVHRSELYGIDFLPTTLARVATIPVTAIRHEERIQPRNIYVVPGGGRLEIGSVSAVVEWNHASARGSIDAMFRSAARMYTDRVVGVILSGKVDDGGAGLLEVRRNHGITIVQDPHEAERSSMPQLAMQSVPVDYCLGAAAIGPKLVELARGWTSAFVTPSARVMIVEDEWLFAAELELQLTELGHEVVAKTASGEEALALARSTRPDIAIMDVRLEGSMRGTETARQLWEQYGVPIIYLTAYADQETLNAAESSMPYAFLPKPQHASQLHAAIQLALGRRELEAKRRA